MTVGITNAASTAINPTVTTVSISVKPPRRGEANTDVRMKYNLAIERIRLSSTTRGDDSGVGVAWSHVNAGTVQPARHTAVTHRVRSVTFYSSRAIRAAGIRARSAPHIG